MRQLGGTHPGSKAGASMGLNLVFLMGCGGVLFFSSVLASRLFDWLERKFR